MNQIFKPSIHSVVRKKVKATAIFEKTKNSLAAAIDHAMEVLTANNTQIAKHEETISGIRAENKALQSHMIEMETTVKKINALL